MVLVYSEKVSAQMTKNEKYATFSRSASRLFNKVPSACPPLKTVATDE
jgi:hypothetical protein